VLSLLFVATVGAGVAATQSTQQATSVTVSPAVDVPDRTTSFQGQTFTIRAIGRAQQGEKLTVSTVAPAGGSYNIYLYNSDRQIEKSRSATGEATVTFDTADLRAGTGSYTVALYQDGVAQTIHPVVVPAYSVTLDAPTTVTTDEELSITGTLQTYEDVTIERVEVVIVNADTTRRETVAQSESMRYATNVSTAGLAEGTYDVYLLVRGTKTMQDQNELIALSDTQSLAVTAPSTPTTEAPTATTTSAPDGGSGGAGGGSGASPPDSTTTSSPSTANSPTETESSATSPTTSRSTTSPRSMTPVPTTATSQSSNGVITPNTPGGETTAGTTAQTSGSPLGAFPLVWATVLVALLVYRWR
jgi:hypothetical protein